MLANVILAIVLWIFGLLLFSFGIMQILISIFCTIPATRRFSKEGYIGTGPIYKRCVATIVVWLVISVVIIGAVLYFGNSFARYGFFAGMVIPFLFSIGKWGMNDSNLQDYFQVYGHYLMPGDSDVSGETELTTDERDSSLLSCNQAQNIVEPHLNEDRGPDHGDGYAPNVETKAEPEKITIKTRRTDKGFMPILLTASMGVGCVALAMLCVVLWTDIKQMKNDMNELTSKNELLEKEIENWDHKYTSMKSAKDGLLSEVRELRESTEKMGFNDFFVRCAIGLIYDGDDTYFHTTQCDNSPDSTFFVMTSKACDTLGLSPCPYCHTSEDLITIQSLIKQ